MSKLRPAKSGTVQGLRYAENLLRSVLSYRGYLIRSNPITGEHWIEKGGTLIQWAKDVEHAKRIVDAMLGD